MNKNYLNLNNPIRLFIFISLTIFIIELGIMLFLQYFILSPSLIVNLIDSLVLILILYPVFYYFIFKPLVKQNNELNSSKILIELKNVKYEAILTSIIDGMVVVDKDRKIIFFNKIAESMTGWSNTDVLGEDILNIIKIKYEQGEVVPLKLNPINVVLSSKKKNFITNNDLSIENIYKKTFPVAISVTPVIYKNEIIGVIFMFRDISRDKEIEKTKSDFISIASHQLKTPSTAIKLLTERLLGKKMGKLSEKQKEYFNDIRNSNQKMIDLINVFLNISKIELGVFSLNLEKKRVVSILEDVLKELDSVVIEKGLSVKFSPEINDIEVIIDESLFRIVINNMIMNAINYSKKEGDISIDCIVSYKGQLTGGVHSKEDSLVIVISDNGCGIPDKDKYKIFSKFFRSENVRKVKTDGTGLGLYIVKSILEHSSGSIWFTSKENVGSVFYLSIPLSGMKEKLIEDKISN